MGNFTSQLPTMFWILKSKNLAGKPNFCTTLAYFLAASLDCSSLLAPVHTIFPELKINAVVRGSLILMMTAANRLGLYSAFLARSAMVFRSSLQPRFTVDTIFWSCGTIPELSEAGVAGVIGVIGVIGEGYKGVVPGNGAVVRV